MRASPMNGLSAPRLNLPRLSVQTLWSLVKLVQSRHQLRMLDDRMLQDIGVSRTQAEIESARPVWDVPQTWRR